MKELRKWSNSVGTISIISDDKEDGLKHKGKKLKTSALEERNTKIKGMADRPKEKDVHDYNNNYGTIIWCSTSFV